MYTDYDYMELFDSESSNKYVHVKRLVERHKLKKILIKKERRKMSEGYSNS